MDFSNNGAKYHEQKARERNGQDFDFGGLLLSSVVGGHKRPHGGSIISSRGHLGSGGGFMSDSGIRGGSGGGPSAST